MIEVSMDSAGFRIEKTWCFQVHLGVCQNPLLSMLVGWTPINPSYFDVHQGYKVSTHSHVDGLVVAGSRPQIDQPFLYSGAVWDHQLQSDG